MTTSKFKLIKQCLRQLCGHSPEKELLKKWETIFGPFDQQDYRRYTSHDLPSESAYYHGEIIRWVQTLDTKPQRTLLAGEAKQAATVLAKIMNLGDITTTGVLDVDIPWNFENTAPEMGSFNLIISQAILEHLLAPYQHMQALSRLLSPGGYLLVHTVTPGFVYHRYPIDAYRFYPDFFELFAERSNLTVCKRRVNDSHIFYLFQQKE